MRCNFWKGIGQMLLGAGLVALSGGAALAVTATTTFQNGVSGYNGTFDRVIDDRALFGGGTPQEVDGSTVIQYGVDGFGTGSPDRPGLIRFDNIIGNGASQIPANAFILDAKLELTTTWGGNATTSGPWGVSGLVAPFNSSTSYTNFPGGRGPWYQDGTATRPVGNFGGALAGDVVRADITALVQSWVDGSMPNHGMAVQAGFTGTTDGWNYFTTGHGVDPTFDFPLYRPKLHVTYTTEDVELNVFQRDLNGYTGDTMVQLIGGADILSPTRASDDVTNDGLTIGESFLDGPDIGTSADNGALLKFNNVFGNGAGQAPSDVPVAKAWLVLTTGDSSADARSIGNFSAYAMKTDWNLSTLHSDLDLGTVPVDGSRRGDDISLALDTQNGISTGSEVWFDVTSYLEGVRTGSPDFGLAVLAGTSDGWQIHFNGSSVPEARPRLVIASSNAAIVSPTLAGDFNADGIVDAADYTVWRDNRGSSFNLNGNGNESGASAGVVDDADYVLWKSSFGNIAGGGLLGSGGAVPEPSTTFLMLVGISLLSALRIRSRS